MDGFHESDCPQFGDDNDGGLLSSILNLISSIGEKIVSLGKTIVDGILDGLKALFIPTDGYLDDTFIRLKDKFSGKLGFSTYLQLFDALKSQVSNSPSFGGYIDTSMWVKYLPQIHAYIKGFFYCLMVIFNVKQIIWMVRGSTPIQDGGRSS